LIRDDIDIADANDRKDVFFYQVCPPFHPGTADLSSAASPRESAR